MAKKVKANKLGNVRSGGSSSNNQVMILVGVVAAALVVLIGFVFISQQSAGEAKTLEEYDAYAGVPIGGQFADVREVTRAEDVAEGVEMGIGEDGIPYIGDPNAPITIAEFADFTCPHCANYHATYEKLIEDFGRTGMAKFEYFPIPAPTRDPAATNAARAALCAGEQGAFWEMHDEIFRVHLAESGSVFSSFDRLEEMADSIGIDGAAMRSCMNTNRVDAAIFATTQLAQDIGANSTPTLVYRMGDSGQWQTIPQGSEIGGGRDYDTMAALILSASTGG